MIDDEPELEYSRFCGDFTSDGITVLVQIYRLKGGDEGWSLEVVDDADASIVWDDRFATDKEAHDEFLRTIRAEGIQSFLVDRGKMN